MAFDKVIDSALLDAGMTATANALRKKAGGSAPIAWDSANGFKAAVEGIDTEGGVELPELGDTAAKPTDMAADKVLYDDEGNPVAGTLVEIPANATVFAINDHSVGGTKGGETFNVSASFSNHSGDGIIARSTSRLGVRNVPTAEFGDATAADVIKGKTFTSAAGFLAEGTHECETGVTLPALTNPAAATDLALDKQLIDADGNTVTGTLPETEVGTKIFGGTGIQINGTPGSTTFNIGGIYQENHIGDNTVGFIARPGAQFWVRNAPTSLFGDAAASDVAKGKTFTSAAGLQVEGTLETGSGGVHMSVDGETLVITGAVTIENETLIL